MYGILKKKFEFKHPAFLHNSVKLIDTGNRNEISNIPNKTVVANKTKLDFD